VEPSRKVFEHAASDGRGRLVLRRELFTRLDGSGRVMLVSAPAGSGKTSLVGSWIAQAGLGDRAAWVPVSRGERDGQAFWQLVLGAVRQTRVGSGLVREVTAAPHLDGSTFVGRLLEDLRSLDEPLWLVIDDLHELEAADTVRELEALIAGAPMELRFVLLTRRDLRLGLHRLRLDGELTEIRGQDLLFTREESRELLATAGVRLSDEALAALTETTEGWAAGVRLAALSLARHPDPNRLAVGFSGRERAVAEYLLAEVLERQPEEVSRLLLRTSLLERVSGPLADRLTGGSGSDLILAELEDANAFVVSLDPERHWFRYHHLFADLLALELRRTLPDELPALHRAAAEWFAERGFPLEAIRHAQAAQKWDLAAELLSDNWRRMYLDGRVATGRELLARFPASVVETHPELAVLDAFGKRAQGSLEEAEQSLNLAARGLDSVASDRRRRFDVTFALARLALARARNDLQAVAEESQQLLAPSAPEAIAFGLGEDLRTTALIDLGVAELWANRLGDAERHLEWGFSEARRIGRPFLELQALAHWALLNYFRSEPVGEERARQAVELAREHGWEETASAAATAYIVLGSLMLWRGRLNEAVPWLERAERIQRQFVQPTAALMMYATQGLLAFAQGRDAESVAAFGDAQRMEGLLVTPHILATRARAASLEVLIRVGEREQVEQALADMNDEVRDASEMRVVVAALRLAQGEPEAAAEALAPLLDGSTPHEAPQWAIQAQLLEAIARDALRDSGAASRALERAFDLAEPVGFLLPFLLHPAPELLERVSRFRTAHGALISDILNLLSGRTPTGEARYAEPLHAPLSDSELRVLRYLPTNLQAPEIAAELVVSVNTIRTHMRHVYAKLGVHRRTDAVDRARELGLVSPTARKQ
jgi:LuxR family transcriptional regulator, maltose regulon positive regulatory protein